jgi:opacity protein-like surface antigen
MKKIILLAILCTITAAQAQPPNVSFRMGLPINAVQFMLSERGNIVPTAGLGYFILKHSSEWRDDYDNESSDITVQYLLPNIGLRRYFEPLENLRHYALAEAFLGIPMVSGSDMSAKSEERMRDALGLFGFRLGGGVEYLVSKQFSIGSEFTFSAVFNSTKYEDEDEYENYSRESSTMLGGTLSRVTLNYYFR